MMFHRYSILSLLLVIPTLNVWGQAEIFGPEGDATIEGPVVQALSDDDPLLKQLLEQAGRGNQLLASSINSLSRLGRWKEVDQLLQTVEQKQLDEKTLAEMFFTIGPDNYLRLKQPGILSDQGVKTLDSLQAAAKNYSQSDQRIRDAINNLVASEEDTRLQATRTLLSGGDSSVQALVAACSQPQPNLKLNRMLSTLVALGEGGTSGLRQLALYGKPEIRPHAMNSLARIDLDKHRIDIATAAHAQDSTNEERALAEQLLDKTGRFPTRGETFKTLSFDLERSVASARRQTNTGANTNIWFVNETLDGITNRRVKTHQAHFRDVYDAASRLQRFGELTGEMKALTTLHTISYELIIDPDWGDAEQLTAMRKRFPTLTNPTALSGLLRDALTIQEIPGAIGLVRIAASQQWTSEQEKQFLAGTAGTPGALATAAVAADTRLRYEASVAISNMAKGQSYAGVSQVRKTLSEMLRLGDQPLAILVETRTEVIIRYENLLRQMGMRVEIASTVAQAQRLADQGGDLRVILAKQQLVDRTPIELIDTIRRTQRGRNIPIAIFGEEEISLGAPRWSAPTEFLFEPVTAVTLNTLLERSNQRYYLPPISEADRTQYREQAQTLLN